MAVRRFTCVRSATSSAKIHRLADTIARMVSVWSFPFRVGGDGSIATVDEGSDEAIEEAIAVAMLTRPGERITVPTFGVVDPAFVGVEAGALQRHCDDFGPDIVITSVISRVQDNRTEAVTVAWEHNQPDGDDALTDFAGGVL